jgi:hypothetical protein
MLLSEIETTKDIGEIPRLQKEKKIDSRFASFG